jgi:hypothetical protein
VEGSSRSPEQGVATMNIIGGLDLPHSTCVCLSVTLATILPRVVGRTTVKRKVAGSNLVSDDFSTCTLPTCKSHNRGLCGYLGRNPGQGVLIGEESQDGHTNKGHTNKNKLSPSPSVSFQSARSGCTQISPPGKKPRW